MTPITKQLQCKRCHHTGFSFTWVFKDEAEEDKAYLMHDGYGFELTDSKILCTTCGEESDYEDEDFLEVVEVVR
jgi:hypothetical protein